MKIQLTNSLLKRISMLIEHNPLWAMLIINEYLDKDNPIRLAYKNKTIDNLQKITYPEKVQIYIEAILAGACLIDLPSYLKNYLAIKSNYKFKNTFSYKHNNQILDRRVSLKNNINYRNQNKKSAFNL
jgi:hypothetical protein